MLTLVALSLAGGDCMDDADALRAGGTGRVLGCMVKARRRDQVLDAVLLAAGRDGGQVIPCRPGARRPGSPGRSPRAAAGGNRVRLRYQPNGRYITISSRKADATISSQGRIRPSASGAD